MGWKDKVRDLADKGQELAAAGAEKAKAEYDRRATERAAQTAPPPGGAPAPFAPPPGAMTAPAATDAPILEVTSHDEGRNATVSVYRDRIERVKQHAFGALSRANQDVEVTPIRAISSVQATKDGFVYTKVTVYASGNTIEFRVGHQEAAELKDTIMRLVLAKDAPAPAPVQAAPQVDLADQIRKLAELRDQGILTDDEFQAKKRQLLGL